MSTAEASEPGSIAAIADGLPIGIFVGKVPGGACVYANNTYRQIAGYSPTFGKEPGEDPGPYTLRGRDGAPYPTESLPFVRALNEKTDIVVDDIVLDHGDGKKTCVRAFARPLFDAAGTVSHVVVALTDITDEIDARARADMVERRLQHLLMHAPLIVFAFDSHGVVTLSEGRGLEGLGLRPQELLGRSVFDVYANRPASLANIRRVLAGEEFTAIGHLSNTVLETTFTPVLDREGAVEGAVGVSMDVTEREKIQGRLVQAERLASMGTLSATVAHEINNPLTYVLANLQIAAKELSVLAADIPAAREVIRRLNEAHEGADRVRRIVRALHAFSRQDDDEAVPTDVNAAVEQALMMADNAIRHRARLVRDLEDVPLVLANDLRLSQVFVNLLMNAAQAIPEGHADTNEIRVRTRCDDDRSQVTILVTDTGSGIAPEVKARIFEPFFTTKPVGKGTGLGLSTCYGIVESFGGRIDVESATGKGATFCVRLPVTGRPRNDSAPKRAVATRPRRSHILIIDDDASVARSLSLILRDEHDVEVSLEPRVAAKRILAGERFDLIFCDLMMPEMTGMDFHELLVKNVPEQAQRIVFVTGGAFTHSARAFAGSVPNAFLEKPFDVNALDDVLSKHLASRP